MSKDERNTYFHIYIHTYYVEYAYYIYNIIYNTYYVYDIFFDNEATIRKRKVGRLCQDESHVF